MEEQDGPFAVGARREISPHLYSYLHTIESDTVIIVLLSPTLYLYAYQPLTQNSTVFS